MKEALLFLFEIVFKLVIENDKMFNSLEEEDYQKLSNPECYFDL